MARPALPKSPLRTYVNRKAHERAQVYERQLRQALLAEGKRLLASGLTVKDAVTAMRKQDAAR